MAISEWIRDYGLLQGVDEYIFGVSKWLGRQLQ